MTERRTYEGWRAENFWRRAEGPQGTAEDFGPSPESEGGEYSYSPRGERRSPARERSPYNVGEPNDSRGHNWFAQRMSYEEWLGEQRRRPVRRTASAVKHAAESAVSTVREKARELKERVAHIGETKREKSTAQVKQER